MIKHEVGDLFSVTEGYIVHGCNAQGVMGAGVAGQIKFYFPEAFDVYKECINIKRAKGKDPLGTNTYLPNGKLVIVNAITQEYYGNDGKLYTSYDAVRSCFKDIKEEIEQWQKIYKDVPRVLNFPLIGCGLGGGDWDIISSIIEEEIGDDFEKVLWTLD
jgi:O-acetyl-ADP-ribose deacetylase (regulator of RNase III)